MITLYRLLDRLDFFDRWIKGKYICWGCGEQFDIPLDELGDDVCPYCGSEDFSKI